MPPRRPRAPRPSTPPHPLPASTRTPSSSIRAAFELFATAGSGTPPGSGVDSAPADSAPADSPSTDSPSSLFLPTASLHRALSALSLPARSRAERGALIEALDPGARGVVAWEDFAAAVRMLEERGANEGGGDDGAGEAWGLFVDAGGVEGGRGEREGGAMKISLEGLRRVAQGLKIEVEDAVLRDMIAEANGLGAGGVARGVGRDEFEAVLRRAGALR